MKAIVVTAPSDIKMIDTEKPQIGSKDVLVRVAYSGICGTDLAIYSGEMSLIKDGSIRYPVRIGHEWSGIVEETGGEVTGFRSGDRVISDSGVTCGECKHCLSGNYGLCESVKSVGTVNCWDGSFAEYMLMPERHLYKLPDDIGLDEAALIEPAAIALSGLKQGGLKHGSSILIIGTGPIGLAAIPLARTMGASRIIVGGRKPFKLDAARVMGADLTVDVTKEDLAAAVFKETEGKGVDIVLETSGNISTISQCIDAVQRAGFIGLIGFYDINLHDFNIDKFVMKSLHMKGILGEFGLPQEVINLREKGAFSLKPLITHRYGFDEAINAFLEAKDLNDTRLKMMVQIEGVL